MIVPAVWLSVPTGCPAALLNPPIVTAKSPPPKSPTPVYVFGTW